MSAFYFKERPNRFEEIAPAICLFHQFSSYAAETALYRSLPGIGVCYSPCREIFRGCVSFGVLT